MGSTGSSQSEHLTDTRAEVASRVVAGRTEQAQRPCPPIDEALTERRKPALHDRESGRHSRAGRLQRRCCCPVRESSLHRWRLGPPGQHAIGGVQQHTWRLPRSDRLFCRLTWSLALPRTLKPANMTNRGCKIVLDGSKRKVVLTSRFTAWGYWFCHAPLRSARWAHEHGSCGGWLDRPRSRSVLGGSLLQTASSKAWFGSGDDGWERC